MPTSQEPATNITSTALCEFLSKSSSEDYTGCPRIGNITEIKTSLKNTSGKVYEVEICSTFFRDGKWWRLDKDFQTLLTEQNRNGNMNQIDASSFKGEVGSSIGSRALSQEGMRGIMSRWKNWKAQSGSGAALGLTEGLQPASKDGLRVFVERKGKFGRSVTDEVHFVWKGEFWDSKKGTAASRSGGLETGNTAPGSLI